MIVHMDCAGCESKIKKALNKLDGMLNWTSVFINLFGFAQEKKILGDMRLHLTIDVALMEG